MVWAFVQLNESLTSIPFTIINWVKQAAQNLPDAPVAQEIPEIAEVDELQTFMQSKKIKFGCGQWLITGILAFSLGS